MREDRRDKGGKMKSRLKLGHNLNTLNWTQLTFSPWPHVIWKLLFCRALLTSDTFVKSASNINSILKIICQNKSLMKLQLILDLQFKAVIWIYTG